MEPRIRAAVITVSDRVSRGEAADSGGPRVAARLTGDGHVDVVETLVVADDRAAIVREIVRLSAAVDLIVTTGGTGLAPRDVTPEATLEAIERRVPGMEEAMRAEGLKHTPLAALSRAVVGTRGACLVVNLPGSPKGVEDGLRAIAASLVHAVSVLRAGVSDCAVERARHER